jgi:hypothetical protein
MLKQIRQFIGIRLCLIGLCVAACLGAATLARSSPVTATVDTQLDALLGNSGMALQDPDKLSWKVFALISRPAQAPVSSTVNSQPVSLYRTVWETWAENQDIFKSPVDLSHPPQWSDLSHPSIAQSQGRRIKHLFRNPLDRLIAVAAAPRGAMRPMIPSPGNGCLDNCLEVRHNQHAFEGIVSSGMWYQEGLKQLVAGGVDANGVPNKAKFANGSVEIKAEWQKYDPVQNSNTIPSHYHTYVDANHTIWLLVGLHIMTKALPTWTWATFEHVDNPGRCDYYGCHDDYGSTRRVIATNGSVAGVYQGDSLSPAGIQELAGLPPEWQYYRLKGTQIAYELNGKHTLLGNSKIEALVHAPSSSCISCHARARVNSAGAPADDGGFVPGTSAKTSPNGPPRPVAPCLRIGFIWSVTRAKAAHPSNPPNTQAPVCPSQ